MNGKWAPRHVALVDGLAGHRAQLRNRLEEGGYAPVLFENSAELLVLLCGGRRFDLLLIVEDGTSAWNQLVTVCSVFGIPVLVLARKSDSAQAGAWLHEFPVSALFDFAFLDCPNVELHKRIARLLHQGVEHQAQSSKTKGAVFGNYKFYEGLFSVSHRGREINMQPRQFQLALELFRNTGIVLDRNRLWAMLWTTPFPSKSVRTLDVCVANVRKKLELFPENGFTLKSVYGRGYQLLAVTPLMAPEPLAELGAVAQPPSGWAANSSPPADQASASPY